VERPGTSPYVAARLGSWSCDRSPCVRILHLSGCHLPRDPGPDVDVAVETAAGDAQPAPGLQQDLAPEPAGPADAEPLLGLREAAAARLAAQGVRQWEPGEVGLDEVAQQVRAGQWHVLRDAGRPVAALRLLWQDEAVWGPQPPVAAYVHGLVVAQQRRGAGVGAALLHWAAARARDRGRSLLRLDCGEDNEALRRYYADQGFRVVGRREAEGRWYSVVLLEREL